MPPSPSNDADQKNASSLAPTPRFYLFRCANRLSYICNNSHLPQPPTSNTQQQPTHNKSNNKKVYKFQNAARRKENGRHRRQRRHGQKSQFFLHPLQIHRSRQPQLHHPTQLQSNPRRCQRCRKIHPNPRPNRHDLGR